ncbi:leucine-rich repeat receptor-like protein kinase TDR isoform X2 [Cucurbita pepo subsp. pepo]|uniref:leucine-rich repeat receptor-like protein kinase TDR isoform X2 n=1 Tax=Cucurbita pepo subsp. pepo TaxID=3664 RepID=UPI000C9D8E53|nr:leucine-rich repeat receptor-like protein kinase TDR isoform X2 [Cucurbita pepo subsp. pepo]
MEVFRCLPFNFIVFFLLCVAASSTDTYSEALLALKSEFIDDFGSLSDWIVRSGQNPLGKIHGCSWSGVQCDKNATIVIGIDLSMKRLGGAISGEQFHVFKELVDLNLSHNYLSGKLPIGIFNLTNLRTLDISRNNFSGHFPVGIFHLQNLIVCDAFSNSFSGSLPVDLPKLENLKFLNLAGSYFTGPIPSEYGSFKTLEFMNLAGNVLTGNLPPELGKLKTMIHMEIGYNSFHGRLPWELGNMSNLQYLDIASGNLSGSIPKELSNLSNLESLFLFRNHFSGLLPEELSKITSLVNLDLSDNHISGPIPESFSEMKNLRLLSLMYNEMTGSVPKGIAELPSLETLLIWSNQFSGSLPKNLGSNKKLKWLDVSTNNFVGHIPLDICLGGLLFKLILFSNKFSGGLSPSLSNCSSLVRLRLEDNLFSGDISLKFSDLPDISYIDLSMNNFSGGIPLDISKASNLQYFNISYNPELGGVFPEEIWSLPLLQNFSASDCGIRGKLPKFRFCKSVLTIELNDNDLSGNVPESVASCHALVRMDLSYNNLSGHIPEELAHLPSIRILDLSHNGFNGSIPDKFRDSSSLLLLNVSSNDISGSIPENKVFWSMGSSAFAGNPKLCGAPLEPCSGPLAMFEGKGMGKLELVLILCAGLAIITTISIALIFFARERSKGKWKMVCFTGLPPFTASDILRSFDSAESKEAITPLSASIFKAVLPTGIAVSIKKIDWEEQRIRMISEFITQLGSLRHKNLVRLLGFCHNKQMVYLLYEYLPNGNLAEKISMKREWLTKLKLIKGIARGLHFLHHGCYPTIPHGDLKLSNVILDENMEPHLAEFGLRFLQQLNEDSLPLSSTTKGGEFNNATEEELWMDVHSFGAIVLEIISNGRLTSAGSSTQNKARDLLLREIYKENGISSPNSSKEEIKQVLDLALVCTRSRPSNRPSMEDVLKLLSEIKPEVKS